MNCIAIDDSANALELIRIHCSKIPFLELRGVYSSALAAVEILKEESIDLIFLDVEMPDVTGIQFVRSLEEKPLVILTTAYPNYALEGFEINAIDYLLKPIGFERFLKAANRAYKQYSLATSPAIDISSSAPNSYILFKGTHETLRIPEHDITIIESQGNYVKVFLRESKSFMSLMTMTEVQKKLDETKFFRCHRSFIIALDHVQSYNNYQVKINDRVIPLAKGYRKAFQERM